MTLKSINFTKRVIDTLPSPEKSRAEYKDVKCSALRLRVSKTGVRSFSVVKRVRGQKVVRVTIGKYPDVPPEAARKAAQQYIADIAFGTNPNLERKKLSVELMSLADAYQLYIKSRRLKEKTKYGYDSVYNCHLVRLHNVALKEIGRDAVLAAHRAIESKAQADLTMRLLRAVFNFAREEFLDEKGSPIFIDNPVKILNHRKQWNRVPRKNTHVRMTEVRTFSDALAELRSGATPTAASVVDSLLFAALTGLRKGEILSLTWNEVDFANGYFYVTEVVAKNHRVLELPITPYVEKIFGWRERELQTAFVFGAENEYGQIREPKKIVSSAADLSGLSCGYSDLRRTFATTAEQLRVGTYTIKRLMNHTSLRNDVTAGYTVLTGEVLRSAALEIQDTMVSQMGWFPRY